MRTILGPNPTEQGGRRLKPNMEIKHDLRGIVIRLINKIRTAQMRTAHYEEACDGNSTKNYVI